MTALLLAAIGGFCLRGALASATEGEAWWALALGVCAVVDFALAIHKVYGAGR